MFILNNNNMKSFNNSTRGIELYLKNIRNLKSIGN